MDCIRHHSADMMAVGDEFTNVTEPVAVVIRPDGSADVYGYVAVIDQRAGDECYDAGGQPLPHGRCDTCGAPCSAGGCTADTAHETALDEEEPPAEEYDPGDEIDDEGGMSEYRHYEPDEYPA